MDIKIRDQELFKKALINLLKEDCQRFCVEEKLRETGTLMDLLDLDVINKILDILGFVECETPMVIEGERHMGYHDYLYAKNMTLKSKLSKELSGKTINLSPFITDDNMYLEMAGFLDWLLEEGKRTDFGKNAYQVYGDSN